MNKLRFAIRMLLKRPLSMAVAVLTLALLIGAVSLGLGVYEHEKSAWMPFPESERLVRFWHSSGGNFSDNLFAPVYQGLKEHLRGVESLGGYGGHTRYFLTKENEPKPVSGVRVSSAVLKAAGVAPQLGRLFTEEEEAEWEDRLVLLSHSFWQEEFGGDPAIVGRSIQLNDLDCQVIGVMPEGYNRNHLFYGVSLWVPGDFEAPGLRTSMGGVVGKLAPGVNRRQLQAELEAIYPEIVRGAGLKGGGERRAIVAPLDEQPGLKKELGEIVFVVALIVFVGLIASLNTTNILLANMSSRKKEFAMRFALGAKRRTLIAQVLSETVVLALVSGAIGICAAVWMAALARSKGIHADLSWTVIAWTMAGAVFIGIVVGWLPALRSTRRELLTELKEGTAGSSAGRSSHRLRNMLVTSQVAMAMVLCTAAGLAVRSYINKKNFDPGFDPANVLELSISLREDRYPELPERILFLDQALRRVAELPEIARVESASTTAINRWPFLHGFQVEGTDVAPGEAPIAHLTVVSPGYLDMINVPVLRGRGFTSDDKEGSEPVVLISESLAKRHFGEDSGIGKRIRMGLRVSSRVAYPPESSGTGGRMDTGLAGGGPEWFTVVGVVPDRRNLGSREDFGPEIYLSGYQVAPDWAQITLLMETRSAPGPLRESVRQAVRSLDYDQPVSGCSLVADHLRQALERDKGMGRTLGAIGLFGLVMSMVGVYGVVSHSIAERRFEMGVRMAVGAGRGDILKLVLRYGLVLGSVGIAVGSGIAACVTVGISKNFFGIGGVDPLTYLLVAGLMFLTTLAASFLPAVRATRVNPVEVLRSA